MISQYSLILKATENCSWIAADVEMLSTHVITNASEIDTKKLIQQNGSLVRITINVQDQNDNPPKFITKVFSGGVTTSGKLVTRSYLIYKVLFY